MKGLGKIGYVANSPFTVKGESMSVGRFYDKIEDKGERKGSVVSPKYLFSSWRGNCSGISDGRSTDNVRDSGHAFREKTDSF